jgi:hypothetical protein
LRCSAKADSRLAGAGVDVARKVKISHVDGTGQVASGGTFAAGVDDDHRFGASRLDSCSD